MKDAAKVGIKNETKPTLKSCLAGCFSVRRVVLMGVGVTLFLFLAGGLAFRIWLSAAEPVVSFAEVRLNFRRSDAVLLDRNGVPLQEVRLDDTVRRLNWTDLANVSPVLLKAVVRAEDRRFWSHHGVDWRALAAGAVQSAFSSRRRGASTISMQVARMVEPDRSTTGQSLIAAKLEQIRSALALEESWSKEQVLEAYFNLVFYRGELQGIAAASRALFDKQPHGLTADEALLLAALIRAPNADSKRVAERAALLARQLRWSHSREPLLTLADQVLSPGYFIRPRADLAPHLARLLLTSDGAAQERIASATLEAPVQAFALSLLQQRLRELTEKNVLDGCILVSDNTSGEVLAYVANAGVSSSARYVDGIMAFRQAGSTLKPLLYALAFEERIVTPASLLEDTPLEMPVAGGVYRPANYDNRFRGLVAARFALASSLNIPAVRTLELVGLERFIGFLSAVGFQGLRTPDYYGPSLALGSADVRLWDLVNAYRMLANGGLWSPMKVQPHQGSREPVRMLSKETAFLISDILSDRESRSLTFTLESPLATPFWTAVKTGTSKDMRDNWCVGYSRRYTVGVWVGNFSGKPMWNVSGMSGAAPLWVEVMEWLHRGEASRAPTPPPGVVSTVVTFPHLDQSRREWFLRGTETNRVVPVSRHTHPARVRIRSPQSGEVFALDPDIPPDRQRLRFVAEQGGDEDLRWQLNGSLLGPSAGGWLWTLEPGRHLLQLVDAGGRSVDGVEFTVR